MSKFVLVVNNTVTIRVEGRGTSWEVDKGYQYWLPLEWPGILRRVQQWDPLQPPNDAGGCPTYAI